LRLEDELSDWKDDDNTDANEEEDEVHKYCSKAFSDEETNSYNVVVEGETMFDIGKFWRITNIKKQFPVLAREATSILSIPASSASSERVFITAGRITEKRRDRLSFKLC
jgi:hypothetical protein